jgi:hypothetical protein
MEERTKMLREMVSKFICPGCICGLDVDDCSSADTGVKVNGNSGSCINHVLGSNLLGICRFALGLPVGFCRAPYGLNKLDVCCYDGWPETGYYNVLNIPVWYMEKDEHTFIRVVAPRIAKYATHVLKGSWGEKLKEEWPSIINVGTHPETQEMD